MRSKSIHISPHTLARLFGVVRPFHKPYRFTLDNLAMFAGFHDWKTYSQSCIRQTPGTDLVMSQNRRGFSLSRMEVAIMTRSHADILTELELLDTHAQPLYLNEIASLLVHYIRTEDQASDILRQMSRTRNGQKMFFDFLVDEDDQDEYYFNALKTYYLPVIRSVRRKMFFSAYLISKEAYRRNCLAPEASDLELLRDKIVLKNLHYQELSRYFESLIIRDGFNGKLEETMQVHINQVLAFAGRKAVHEASWILYRPLRALVFFGYKEPVICNPSIGKLFETILRKINIQNASTADFAIQLIYLAGGQINIKLSHYQPFKLQSHYLHCDSKERQSMEIATAYLLSNEADSDFFRTNLKHYCSLNSATWVCRLLF